MSTLKDIWKETFGASPPSDVNALGEAVGNVLEKGQEALDKKLEAGLKTSLNVLGKELDARLKCLEPLTAFVEKQNAEEQSKAEEEKLLDQMNALRAKRGLPPIVAEKDGDDMDDDDDKKGTGHKKKGKESPFEKKDDDDEDKKESNSRLTNIEAQLAQISTALKSVGANVGPSPLDVASFDSSANVHELTAGAKPRKVPFEKSWNYLMTVAPAIRGELVALDEFECVVEFDTLVSNAKHQLKKEGVKQPKYADLVKGV